MEHSFPFGSDPNLTSMDFLEASFDDVLAGLDETMRRLPQWHTDHWPMPPRHVFPNLSPLEKVARNRPRMSMGVTHFGLTETRGRWACVWANGQHGINGMPTLEMTAERMGVRCLRFVYSEEKGAESTQFGLYDFCNGKKELRAIMLQHEGGWTFEVYGTPLPFEQTDAYKAKRKRDRLTPQMLGDYAAALGIELFDADFYSGRYAEVGFWPIPGARARLIWALTTPSHPTGAGTAGRLSPGGFHAPAGRPAARRG